MEHKILYKELAEILTAENEIHDNLIRAAENINESARAKDIEGIQKRSALFDECLNGLERSEERRNDVCTQLHGMLGGKAPSGRMQTIIEYADPELRENLKNLRKSLMEKVTKLKAVNTSNIILFREALGGIHADIDIIKATATPKAGYQHRGSIKQGDCHLSLFIQVV